LFEEIKSLKNQLGLDTEELLSTLILGIVSDKGTHGRFITIGDGVVFTDGQIHEYEQNNTPDYLGYHLTEDFNAWYQNQAQKLEVNQFKNLSIATDGIFTFENLSDKKKQKPADEIINYLLTDTAYDDNKNMLERKLRELRQHQNHVVTDDLAIIRIII